MRAQGHGAPQTGIVTVFLQLHVCGGPFPFGGLYCEIRRRGFFMYCRFLAGGLTAALTLLLTLACGTGALERRR